MAHWHRYGEGKNDKPSSVSTPPALHARAVSDGSGSGILSTTPRIQRSATYSLTAVPGRTNASAPSQQVRSRRAGIVDPALLAQLPMQIETLVSTLRRSPNLHRGLYEKYKSIALSLEACLSDSTLNDTAKTTWSVSSFSSQLDKMISEEAAAPYRKAQKEKVLDPLVLLHAGILRFSSTYQEQLKHRWTETTRSGSDSQEDFHNSERVFETEQVKLRAAATLWDALYMFLIFAGASIGDIAVLWQSVADSTNADVLWMSAAESHQPHSRTSSSILQPITPHTTPRRQQPSSTLINIVHSPFAIKPSTSTAPGAGAAASSRRHTSGVIDGLDALCEQHFVDNLVYSVACFRDVALLMARCFEVQFPLNDASINETAVRNTVTQDTSTLMSVGAAGTAAAPAPPSSVIHPEDALRDHLHRVDVACRYVLATVSTIRRNCYAAQLRDNVTEPLREVLEKRHGKVGSLRHIAVGSYSSGNGTQSSPREKHRGHSAVEIESTPSQVINGAWKSLVKLNEEYYQSILSHVLKYADIE